MRCSRRLTLLPASGSHHTCSRQPGNLLPRGHPLQSHVSQAPQTESRACCPEPPLATAPSPQHYHSRSLRLQIHAFHLTPQKASRCIPSILFAESSFTHPSFPSPQGPLLRLFQNSLLSSLFQLPFLSCAQSHLWHSMFLNTSRYHLSARPMKVSNPQNGIQSSRLKIILTLTCIPILSLSLDNL